MELTREEHRAALYAVSSLKTERELGGWCVPKEVLALQRRLHEAWVQSVSRPRQQLSAVERESEAWTTRIGTTSAAQMLGWSTRRVQRHADALGGELIAGQWVFREHGITDYMQRNQLLDKEHPA